MPPGGERLRRVGRVGAGGALLALGLVLVVLPGPGLPVVAAGLHLLGSELRWARRARRALLALTVRLRRRVARPGARWALDRVRPPRPRRPRGAHPLQIG